MMPTNFPEDRLFQHLYNQGFVDSQGRATQENINLTGGHIPYSLTPEEINNITDSVKAQFLPKISNYDHVLRGQLIAKKLNEITEVLEKQVTTKDHDIRIVREEDNKIGASKRDLQLLMRMLIKGYTLKDHTFDVDTLTWIRSLKNKPDSEIERNQYSESDYQNANEIWKLFSKKA